MTEQEFSKIAMAIKTYYPKEPIMPNPQAMALWYQQLQDIPYNVCQLAVNKWVSTNKWCPTIADIRETVSGLTDNTKSYGEAWQEIVTAIGKYGRYQVDKAYESMSELTRQACKQIGFENICNSEYIISERAQFEKIYNGLVQRKREREQLPQNIRALISEMSCLQIAEKNS